MSGMKPTQKFRESKSLFGFVTLVAVVAGNQADSVSQCGRGNIEF